MPCVGAGIAGRDRLVAFGIFAQGDGRLGGVAEQLGLDPLEPGLDFRIRWFVPGGIFLVNISEQSDPFPGKRVGSTVAVFLRNTEAELIILQLLEKIDGAFAGYAGFSQIASTRGIGGPFLYPAEGEELAHRGLLSRSQYAHACVAGARCYGRGAQYQTQNGNAGGCLHTFVKADDMPASDMPQFVGHDTLYLIGAVCGFDKTGIEINPLSTGDKGIDLTIVDQHNLDLVGIQFGYRHQGRNHVGEQRLGLCVAQYRLRGDGLHDDRNHRQKRHHEAGQATSDR